MNYYIAEQLPEVEAMMASDWMFAGRYTFDVVDKSCKEWLNGASRHKRPMPGDIRELCDAEMESIRIRSQTFLPSDGKPINRPLLGQHTRMLGGMPVSPYTLQDAKDWQVERQAWFDSPDYPLPPFQCRCKHDPSLTVEQFWERQKAETECR